MPDDPAPVTTPVIVPAIPWYKSPITLWAAGIVLAALSSLFPQIPKVLHKAGIMSVGDLLQFIAACGALIGGLAIGLQRILSKIAPVTWGRRSAAQHVNTKAVAEVQAKMAEKGVPTAAVTKDTMLHDPTQAAKDSVPPASSI